MPRHTGELNDELSSENYSSVKFSVSVGNQSQTANGLEPKEASH